MHKHAINDELDELMANAELFSALGEPQRLAMIADLTVSGRAKTVSDIATAVPIDVSVVSRHLKILRDAGAVRSQRRGRRVLYWIDYADLSSLLRRLADTIDACCPPTSPADDNEN